MRTPFRSAYNFSNGEHVRLAGRIGTPSQKHAIWVVFDVEGFETIALHRLDDKDCVIYYKAHEVERVSPLEALAMQAD